MSRAIVNFSTGTYVKGAHRLWSAFSPAERVLWMSQCDGCPSHADVPYAFKGYALKQAEQHGIDTMIWADACIVPGARPLADLWAYIEEHGIWFARNGYSNYEWTAASAYPDLFPEMGIVDAIRTNQSIPHVVATSFGLSLRHPKALAFLNEYYRLASETKAFCGPWINGRGLAPRYGDCGLADVRGHRHDQTCASVIAWRLGVPLTECPEWFSYKGGETDKTCLIADGAY